MKRLGCCAGRALAICVSVQCWIRFATFRGLVNLMASAGDKRFNLPSKFITECVNVLRHIVVDGGAVTRRGGRTQTFDLRQRCGEPFESSRYSLRLDRRQRMHAVGYPKYLQGQYL